MVLCDNVHILFGSLCAHHDGIVLFQQFDQANLQCPDLYYHSEFLSNRSISWHPIYIYFDLRKI